MFPSHRRLFPLASASISELTQRKGPGLLARTSQDTLQRRSFLHLSLASRLHCPLRLPRGSIHREGSPLGVSHGHERGGGRREAGGETEPASSLHLLDQRVRSDAWIETWSSEEITEPEGLRGVSASSPLHTRQGHAQWYGFVQRFWLGQLAFAVAEFKGQLQEDGGRRRDSH